jgi:NADH-quinone oxidoreductase subunit L
MHFPDFHDRPGLLFVVATFLPLVSFLLLFLARGLWAALRPYRESPGAGALYELLGGDGGGRGGAYLATAAIALAFVLCMTGFVLFTREQGAYEKERAAQEKTIEDYRGQRAAARDPGLREKLGEKIEEEERHLAEVDRRWEEARNYGWRGRVDWLRLYPAGLRDPDRGTALQLGFAIDNLSALMFVMVTFVASLIHLFSIGYMSEELRPVVEDHDVHTAHGHLHRRGRFPRFFMFLSLFCFSMLNLILADNLFQVFVSWELVGICSYLLIGFYYERQSASNAANKAFITNRVGDAGFILGLLILWTYVGSFNFEDIFRQVRAPVRDAAGAVEAGATIVRGNPAGEPGPDGGRRLHLDADGSEVVLFPRELPADYKGPRRGSEMTVYPAPAPTQHGSMPYWLLVAAGLGIFLGCVGKSAQFPLHVWLPDAMEGPTPVSALIHAATMVAAGVYLVGRVYPLFTPEALLVIAYTGGITLFVAATIAVVMTDIKKVLAYSTVSQLGYMMLALGVGGWVAGLFHLLTHAFFKALLFLGSGSVIYGCHHVQDMRQMGGLYPKMKVTALTMLAGVLAIAGTPLFTGWYSKDSILAQAFGYAWVHREHLLLFLLPLATAGVTAFYMARMWFMTFTGPPRDEHVHEHAHESPWTMTVPLVVLAACSVFVAWGWPIWNAKASWLEHTIHHAQPTSVLAEFGHLPRVTSPEGDVLEEGEVWAFAKDVDLNERLIGDRNHELVGGLALGLVALGVLFASLLYYSRVLDPEEARAQFPRLHAFLSDKWRFDDLYSVALVRPTLVVAHWLRAFDQYVIDGILHGGARFTVWLSRWDGRFDNGVAWRGPVHGVAVAVGRPLRQRRRGRPGQPGRRRLLRHRRPAARPADGLPAELHPVPRPGRGGHLRGAVLPRDRGRGRLRPGFLTPNGQPPECTHG